MNAPVLIHAHAIKPQESPQTALARRLGSVVPTALAMAPRLAAAPERALAVIAAAPATAARASAAALHVTARIS